MNIFMSLISVTRITEIPEYYRNTGEKYRYTCERHLLKIPILALINQLSIIMST